MAHQTPQPDRDATRLRNRNRRREGYELTKQRNMVPIAIGALIGTLVCHSVAYVYFPDLLGEKITLRERDLKDEEVVQIFVRENKEEVPQEAQIEELQEDPAQLPDEPEELQEIDLLDIDMPEMTLAPGPTELAMPQPEITDSTAPASETLKPEQLEVGALQVQELQAESIAVPEPAPINSNAVIINATPQKDLLEDAEGLSRSDLEQTAREGNVELPSDTRSLSELMGLAKLGQASGVARLGTDVLFGFNESELKNSARITMLQLAALIHKNPETYFIIEGHTDSIGTAAYNDLLSLQRAAAVREWLRGNEVPVSHVYIRACGSRNLLVSGTADRKKQAINRRVEIHMRSQTEKLPPGCVDASYKVNLKTPVREQLNQGVRAPSPGGSINKAYQASPSAQEGSADRIAEDPDAPPAHTEALRPATDLQAAPWTTERRRH